ncbi:hypothetical protein D3C85_1731100 [compost metagenome]
MIRADVFAECKLVFTAGNRDDRRAKRLAHADRGGTRASSPSQNDNDVALGNWHLLDERGIGSTKSH